MKPLSIYCPKNEGSPQQSCRGIGLQEKNLVYRSPAERDFRFAATNFGELYPKKVVCACPVK
jgi:hypothetical protein